jgi:hypothetical protein
MSTGQLLASITHARIHTAAMMRESRMKQRGRRTFNLGSSWCGRVHPHTCARMVACVCVWSSSPCSSSFEFLSPSLKQPNGNDSVPNESQYVRFAWVAIVSCLLVRPLRPCRMVMMLIPSSEESMESFDRLYPCRFVIRTIRIAIASFTLHSDEGSH